jgi:ABC-type lipoprotein export system ATPase subunit
MIQFDDVSKVYRTRRGEVRALNQLSLTINKGQYVAVRGPSGCGKSTLLSLIGGLALPTSGTVAVNDFVISNGSSAERAKFRAGNIGYVFQMFHLLPFLNVLDNVLVASDQIGGEVRERATELLEQLGLQPRCHHRPAQLSAGERQRVALARALLNRPQILLADEPTGNLDPKNADAVLDQVDEFHRAGGTVVLVTHEEPATARAETVVELEQGQLVASPASPT